MLGLNEHLGQAHLVVEALRGGVVLAEGVVGEENLVGYTTERGSTYNAYLIMDEKITLIDTCKRPFGSM